MSVATPTPLIDDKAPFWPLSQDISQLPSEVVGKESAEAVAARARTPLVSKEPAKRYRLWISGDDRWETGAESVPAKIAESRFEELEIGEASDADEEAPSDAATIENSRRLQLLARKYARKALTNEEQVRLDILTERVRRLMPRVTATDLEKLEELAQEAAHLREIAENVRRK